MAEKTPFVTQAQVEAIASQYPTPYPALISILQECGCGVDGSMQLVRCAETPADYFATLDDLPVGQRLKQARP